MQQLSTACGIVLLPHCEYVRLRCTASASYEAPPSRFVVPPAVVELRIWTAAVSASKPFLLKTPLHNGLDSRVQVVSGRLRVTASQPAACFQLVGDASAPRSCYAPRHAAKLMSTMQLPPKKVG
jgi:hypothetical protein